MTRISKVKPIRLPLSTTEEGKLVPSALLAYPELDFARFVVLVEGDSERVALPKRGWGQDGGQGLSEIGLILSEGRGTFRTNAGLICPKLAVYFGQR